jgi:hypothetical protein
VQAIRGTGKEAESHNLGELKKNGDMAGASASATTTMHHFLQLGSQNLLQRYLETCYHEEQHPSYPKSFDLLMLCWWEVSGSATGG